MLRVTCLLALLLLSTLSVQAQQTHDLAPRTAAVEMLNGRPVLVVDDQPMQPMLYALTDVPGGRWSWEELPQHNIAQFCERGVRLYQLDLFFDHVWLPDGTIDVTMAQKQIRGVLDVCPAASVIFRFHVTAPKWWTAQHPDEWVAYADADYQPEQPFGLPRLIEDDLYPVRRVSMASEKWRTEATEKLEVFLDRFSATPEGNALIGMQVANGVYGEWHNWGFFYHEPDVGTPMQAAFRDWLRDTYETNDALQAAWNDTTVTFATATVPGMDGRKTTHGIFRDPQQEQRTIDYYRAMQEGVADNIIHFARTVKAHWPRPIVTGTFYGYYFSMFGRQAPGGHLEMERILTSPHLDYLSGPRAYEPEAQDVGDPYRSRGLIPTVRLNDKLWLDEMDLEVKLPMYRSPRYVERLQTAV
ncbi:MAG: hypothetical protein GVY18_06045, partial [Bacteroidetes bacterium]|nr:hypothetical protein [Bacteroidota bacterium]